MAASSSSQSRAPTACEPFSCSSPLRAPAHDIFLSHSGAQKPFVKVLYERLRTQYSTFFDITDHSLPLGEDFPSRILRAAQSCRLAVVVLSEEYAQSKWTMLELFYSFTSTRQPKILPLFFKLTVDDLKQEENLVRWRSAWKKFEEKDPSRINAVAWEDAFKKVSSRNGIALNECEEESAYVERVFSRICTSVPPSIRHDFSGIQDIHGLSESVLAKFEALNNDGSKVCVLGMYGLPGSGKSTICRYLSEYLFPQFAGKAIYLELPTDADDNELLIKAKELLKKLTDFNNKMDLSSVSNFRQVYYMLERTDFISSRLFLVLDNISSQKSSNVVKALLRLSLTVGSKVLLVAHSYSVLCPLLQEDGSHQRSHYVYGSMRVPCLSDEKALRVLLQSGDGVGLPNSYAPEAALTPRHKQIMEEVLIMSGFPEQCGRITHLPLVLKIMGEELKRHKLNVEKWSRTVKIFQKVGLCKEEVLRQMVLKRFKKMPEKRQVLFLDLALFIVPLSYSDGKSDKLEEVCSHLSLIHNCDPGKIEFEMEELQQQGFLNLWSSTISVHDFYLEFAASIEEEAAKYYWSSGSRWSKLRCNQAIQVVSTPQFELRTAVLELDEGCEHFEFSSGFSTVRTMVLRNSKSLKTLKGFKNLRNLVNLWIQNCPSLKWTVLPAFVKRLEWVNHVERKPNVKMREHRELQTSSSRKGIWRLVWDQLHQIGFMSCRMTVNSLLFQMRELQIFRLENTGIRGCVDINGCLPQLKILEVREHYMKSLCVRNLPNLERFVFFGDAMLAGDDDMAATMKSWVWMSVIFMIQYWRMWPNVYEHWGWKSTVPKMRAVWGKDLLDGCPKLQEVCLHYVAVNDGGLASSQLRQRQVNGLWNGLRFLNFTATAKFLEKLYLSRCQDLKSLNLGCGFRNLKKFYLRECGYVAELSGFGGVSMLQKLVIWHCPSLKRMSGLGNLVSLRKISVGHCPNIQRCLLPDLENLIELKSIRVLHNLWNGNGIFNVRKLVKLYGLNVDRSCDSLLGLENLKCLKDLYLTGQTGGVDLATVTGIRVPCCFELQTLKLNGLKNLRSLNGIEFLGSLWILRLRNLQNLTCLRDIECLEKLKSLTVRGCAAVEEIPSLSHLLKMELFSIWGCKMLRNVDWCGLIGELKNLEIRRMGFSMQLTSVEWKVKKEREIVMGAWKKEVDTLEPLSVTDSHLRQCHRTMLNDMFNNEESTNNVNYDNDSEGKVNRSSLYDNGFQYARGDLFMYNPTGGLIAQFEWHKDKP